MLLSCLLYFFLSSWKKTSVLYCTPMIYRMNRKKNIFFRLSPVYIVYYFMRGFSFQNLWLYYTRFTTFCRKINAIFFSFRIESTNIDFFKHSIVYTLHSWNRVTSMLVLPENLFTCIFKIFPRDFGDHIFR